MLFLAYLSVLRSIGCYVFWLFLVVAGIVVAVIKIPSCVYGTVMPDIRSNPIHALSIIVERI